MGGELAKDDDDDSSPTPSDGRNDDSLITTHHHLSVEQAIRTQASYHTRVPFNLLKFPRTNIKCQYIHI